MKLDIETSSFTKACHVVVPDIFYRRMKTGFVELDEAFGSGLLPGCSVTVTAPAGCGKTTLLLQLFQSLSNQGYEVGYASGEENIHQLAFNCRRLNVTSVNIANITDVDTIVKYTEMYDALVVDSFQALTTDKNLNTRKHESYAINNLVSAAKRNECTIFFVLHLTKGGVLKGSTLIPHTVDVNMQIMPDKDSQDPTARIISISKNRFGPCIDYTSLLTEKGFIFTGVKVDDTPLTKKDRNRQNIDKVLEMERNITKITVIKELGITPSQAYVLLKSMCDMGHLMKIGRGDDAYYQILNND